MADKIIPSRTDITIKDGGPQCSICTHYEKEHSFPNQQCSRLMYEIDTGMPGAIKGRAYCDCPGFKK